MIIRFLKRSVIEVLGAVCALASIFAYFIVASVISQALGLGGTGFTILLSAMYGSIYETFNGITHWFERWKQRAGVSRLW